MLCRDARGALEISGPNVNLRVGNGAVLWRETDEKIGDSDCGVLHLRDYREFCIADRSGWRYKSEF